MSSSKSRGDSDEIISSTTDVIIESILSEPMFNSYLNTSFRQIIQNETNSKTMKNSTVSSSSVSSSYNKLNSIQLNEAADRVIDKTFSDLNLEAMIIQEYQQNKLKQQQQNKSPTGFNKSILNTPNKNVKSNNNRIELDESEIILLPNYSMEEPFIQNTHSPRSELSSSSSTTTANNNNNVGRQHVHFQITQLPSRRRQQIATSKYTSTVDDMIEKQRLEKNKLVRSSSVQSYFNEFENNNDLNTSVNLSDDISNASTVSIGNSMSVNNLVQYHFDLLEQESNRDNSDHMNNNNESSILYTSSTISTSSYTLHNISHSNSTNNNMNTNNNTGGIVSLLHLPKVHVVDNGYYVDEYGHFEEVSSSTDNSPRLLPPSYRPPLHPYSTSTTNSPTATAGTTTTGSVDNNTSSSSDKFFCPGFNNNQSATIPSTSTTSNTTTIPVGTGSTALGTTSTTTGNINPTESKDQLSYSASPSPVSLCSSIQYDDDDNNNNNNNNDNNNNNNNA